MDIQSLFSIQKELNDRIITEHNLKGKSLFKEQQLAFLVELSELANETRSFKYWSKKSASERPIILEEYVDGLHFVLTLGITLGFEDVAVYEYTRSGNTLTEQFLIVMNQVFGLDQERTKVRYQQLVDSFLQLGYQLGFSNTEVEAAYLAKNKINHDRQDSGY